MRNAFRLVLAAAVAALAAGGTRAQAPKFAAENVFTFAPLPAPPEVTEVPFQGKIIETTYGASTDLKFRPNSTTEVFVWVLNPFKGDAVKDRQEFTIEMQVAGGPAVRTKAVIPPRTWVRVRLPKPAPPAPVVPPPVAVVPPAPAGAPAAKAPEPPPPGAPLPLKDGAGTVVFRLLDKAGNEVVDENGGAYGGPYKVSVLPLTAYVNTPVVTVTPQKRFADVTATVTQKPFRTPGTAVVRLSFPPQEGLKEAFIRDGFFRRTLTFDTRAAFDEKNPAPKVKLAGRIENPGRLVRVYVGVDGIDRAFPFTLDLEGTTPDTQIIEEKEPRVRVARVAPADVTAPVATYPVLVEVDRPGDVDTLELRYRPVGAGADLTESVRLDTVRDEAIWLDPAGPKDGGLLFTTRSRDWVKPLDLSHLQGKVEVFAVARSGGKDVPSDNSLVLTVDGTPPEPITFLRIAKTLEKGKPLRLRASVNDPDTAVTKATFFLFKTFDEGKIPPDALKAVGTQTPGNPRVWAADLKVAPDLRGDFLVAAVFANEAGLVTDPPLVQRIEIVDPLPPTGTITGTVTFGERAQPGVAISLRDAEGKEKGAMSTDKDGKFEFVRVPVGAYRVFAIKRDSSTGATGTAPAVVEAEKTTKVPIALEKVRQ
jgi:hypothetical protein